MSSKVRTKFFCQSVTETLDHNQNHLFNYQFGAVYDNSPENAEFWRWTPNGNIQLSAVKRDLFDLGKEYYIDFVLAQKEIPAV